MKKHYFTYLVHLSQEQRSCLLSSSVKLLHKQESDCFECFADLFASLMLHGLPCSIIFANFSERFTVFKALTVFNIHAEWNVSGSRT